VEKTWKIVVSICSLSSSRSQVQNNKTTDGTKNEKKTGVENIKQKEIQIDKNKSRNNHRSE
jgi:hypothetical protein